MSSESRLEVHLAYNTYLISVIRVFFCQRNVSFYVDTYMGVARMASLILHTWDQIHTSVQKVKTSLVYLTWFSA